MEHTGMLLALDKSKHVAAEIKGKHITEMK